jgi:probable addiction module antidote protein
MPLKTFPFDAADYLDCDEAVEAFLQDALDSNEPIEIADALVVIARAKGLTAVAEAAGLTKDMPAAPPPTWPTLLKVISGLGLKLTPVTVKSAA